MKMSMPADAYIRQVEEAAGRVLWNDANYPEFRQKTTEKSKYYRKVLKIYDKSFEVGEKGRNVGANIYVSRPCINTSQYRWRDSLIMHT